MLELRVRAVDLAGNASTMSMPFTVDGTSTSITTTAAQLLLDARFSIVGNTPGASAAFLDSRLPFARLLRQSARSDQPATETEAPSSIADQIRPRRTGSGGYGSDDELTPTPSTPLDGFLRILRGVPQSLRDLFTPPKVDGRSRTDASKPDDTAQGTPISETTIETLETSDAAPCVRRDVESFHQSWLVHGSHPTGHEESPAKRISVQNRDDLDIAFSSQFEEDSAAELALLAMSLTWVRPRRAARRV